MSAPDLTCTDCRNKAARCACPRGPRFATDREAWTWAEHEIRGLKAELHQERTANEPLRRRIDQLSAELNANVLTSDHERAEAIIAALSKWWGCEHIAHPSTDTTSEERLILHHLREVRMAAKLLWLGREQELRDIADELEERYRDASLDNDNLRAEVERLRGLL